jgi:hypothetical protein
MTPEDVRWAELRSVAAFDLTAGDTFATPAAFAAYTTRADGTVYPVFGLGGFTRVWTVAGVDGGTVRATGHDGLVAEQAPDSGTTVLRVESAERRELVRTFAAHAEAADFRDRLGRWLDTPYAPLPEETP